MDRVVVRENGRSILVASQYNLLDPPLGLCGVLRIIPLMRCSLSNTLNDALRFFRINLTINNWFLLSHKQGRGELKILAHLIDNQFSLALLLLTTALNNKSVMKSCERRVSDSL